jgi:transglutaminase-like putative cysteine protease
VKLRSVVGVSILGGWSLVLSLHVRREYFLSEADRLEAGVKRLAPGYHFYVVRMNGRAMGTATTRLDTIGDTLQLEDNLLVDVPALDTVTRAATMSRLDLDQRLGMRKFAFRLDSKIGSFVAEGLMQPDSTLEIVLNAGGNTERSSVRANGGVTLDGAVAMRIAAAGRLVPGTEVRVRTFDPSALATRDMLVRITDTDTLIVPDSARVESGKWVMSSLDTVPVWRLEQNVGGISIGSWVDEDGMMVRAESPLGFVIERTTYELARQEWADASRDLSLAAGYGALIEGTAIASNVRLDSLEERKQLTVRLKGVELAGFDLDGGRQSLSGDTLRITREDLLADRRPAGYRLPYHAIDSIAAELNATPLIQSDHPEIRRTAREATSGTPDPHAAAFRIARFVHRYLRKEITPSIPSALQVLHARSGDCNEHTVLFVALARSIGVPARTAVGLVHLRGRFYYHAWPEIWIGGRWLAIDPTLNQFPADASHIRFLVGGLARQVELLRLIGRLEIEVL